MCLNVCACVCVEWVGVHARASVIQRTPSHVFIYVFILKERERERKPVRKLTIVNDRYCVKWSDT